MKSFLFSTQNCETFRQVFNFQEFQWKQSVQQSRKKIVKSEKIVKPS